mmetsp:Transcript_5259/g.12637  ORF Transcript_5259/g.12637 Transcript_5259/m.12637 type:complete len:214 (-) Transcript_5259:496-1137(-)
MMRPPPGISLSRLRHPATVFFMSSRRLSAAVRAASSSSFLRSLSAARSAALRRFFSGLTTHTCAAVTTTAAAVNTTAAATGSGPSRTLIGTDSACPPREPPRRSVTPEGPTRSARSQPESVSTKLRPPPSSRCQPERARADLARRKAPPSEPSARYLPTKRWRVVVSSGLEPMRLAPTLKEHASRRCLMSSRRKRGVDIDSMSSWSASSPCAW